jgi:soluble lytic murein transglycosylase-like protein
MVYRHGFHGRLLAFLVIFSVAPCLAAFSETAEPHNVDGLDELYQKGKYSDFLDLVNETLQKSQYARENEVLQAQIAIAFQRTGNHRQAALVWHKVQRENPLLPDYYAWQQGLNSLALRDTSEALSHWRNVLSSQPQSPIALRLGKLLADFSLQSGNYEEAYSDYLDYREQLLIVDEKIDSVLYALYSLAKKMDNMQAQNEHVEAMLYQYPASPLALAILDQERLSQSLSDLSPRLKMQLVRVLLANKKYSRAESLLSTLGQEYAEDNPAMRNYYWAELAFRRKQYSTAHKRYSALKLRQFSVPSQRHILRQIARSSYRKGYKTRAYKEFLTLFNRFPDWPRSSSYIWMMAREAERKQQWNIALDRYRQLTRALANRDEGFRAHFRIALIHYQRDNFSAAIENLEIIRRGAKRKMRRDQASFWLAKVYAKKGNGNKQKTILAQLAQQPIRNYYTMRSYTLLDSFPLNSAPWHLNNDQTAPDFLLSQAFSRQLNQYRKVMAVWELFGKTEALTFLQSSPLADNAGLDSHLARIHLLRLLGDYGRAYRLQIRLVYKFFPQAEWTFSSPTLQLIYPLFYEEDIFAVASEKEFPPELAFAVIRQESAFDREAESWVGAYGLMQLMPATAKSLHQRYFNSPWQPNRLGEANYNVQLGTQYLSNQVKRFNGAIPLVLAAYNAGPTRAARWQKNYESVPIDLFIEQIALDETRNYVRKCLRNYWIYKIILGREQNDLFIYDNTEISAGSGY